MDSLTHDKTKDAAAVAAFAASFSSPRCAVCRCGGSVSPRDIERFFAADGHEFHLTCHSCAETTCLGCGSHIIATTDMLSKHTVDGRPLRWHCDSSRTILLWAFLCAYDHRRDRSLHSEKQPPDPPSNNRARSIAKNGTGYSLDDYHYLPSTELEAKQLHEAILQGYDGMPPGFTSIAETNLPPVSSSEGHHHVQADGETLPEHSAAKSTQVSHAKEKSLESHDTVATRVISAVAALLPTPAKLHESAQYDDSPPHLLKSLLVRSSILDTAVELLRNSSLEDIAQRFALYNALNAMIFALAQSAPTLEAIMQPRRINKLGHNLLKLSLLPQMKVLGTRLVDEPEAFSTPLLGTMNDMFDQCAAIEHSASIVPEEFADDESQKLLLLCRGFLDTTRSLRALHVSEGSAYVSYGGLQNPNAWQKNVAILAVPDDQIQPSHSYNAEAVDTALQASSIGRMRRILKEVASLKANLPPNIFVRYAESRPDLMKVLIVGPEGTPYENGLFEFDLFCPYDYPHAPPKMTLRTTGRGVVRFNPNLYNTGYVCLSLLGTWSGETWDPARSTILQVLVSIQAMVFCEQPYCNEPGRSALGGTEQSREYDRHLYPNVVRFGMLEWIDGKVSEGSDPLTSKHYTPPVFMGNLEPDHLAALPTGSHPHALSAPTSLLPAKHSPFQPYHVDYSSPTVPSMAPTALAAEVDPTAGNPFNTVSKALDTSQTSSTFWFSPSSGEDTDNQPKVSEDQSQSEWFEVGNETGSKLGFTAYDGSQAFDEAQISKSMLEYPTEQVSNTEYLEKRVAGKKVQAPRKAKSASPYGSAENRAAAQDGMISINPKHKSVLQAPSKTNDGPVHSKKPRKAKHSGDPLPFLMANESDSSTSSSPFDSRTTDISLQGGKKRHHSKKSKDGNQPVGEAHHQSPLAALTKNSMSSLSSPHAYSPYSQAYMSSNESGQAGIHGPTPKAVKKPAPSARLMKSEPMLAAGTKLVSVFDEVARLHFEHNRDTIIKTVQGWTKERLDANKAGETPGKHASHKPPKKKKKALVDEAVVVDELLSENEAEVDVDEVELSPIDSSAPLRDHLVRALEDMGDSFRTHYHWA